MNINGTTTVNSEIPSAQKSHAEIIAECYHNTAATRYVRKLLDRLEEAHKRECGDMAKLREVMNRVHDYLGELIRDNLVEDTPRASDLADDVYDAIHGSHPTAEKSSATEKTNGLPLFNNARGIDLSNVHAVCNDCASSLGFTRRDKAVGVWVGECEVCHQRKPCTDLWHDWEPAKKGGAK